jgi:high-affinity iron transporter
LTIPDELANVGIENHSQFTLRWRDYAMVTSTTTLPYFLYSSGILFREGLEALLVIIALVAAVRQTGQPTRTRDIYTGALIALACSIGLAWAVQHLLGDNTSDTLEGVFQLFAVVTLFYVSSWMTSKSQAKQWKNFIGAQVEAARRSKGPSVALGLTAFLAVMREGAETIVFFQALTAGATETAERHAIFIGVVAGTLALALTFVGLRKVTFMIPIGPVFTATSVLLYALAVVFAGQGIASFQESGVVGATFVSHVPTLPMLGLYPTIQTLVAQGILLILAMVALVFPLTKRIRLATSRAESRYDIGRAG